MGTCVECMQLKQCMSSISKCDMGTCIEVMQLKQRKPSYQYTKGLLSLSVCSSEKVCLHISEQQGYFHWLHAAQTKCVFHLKVKHGYFYWLHVAQTNVFPSGFWTFSQYQPNAPREHRKPVAKRMEKYSWNLNQASNPILFHTTLHEYSLANSAVWCKSISMNVKMNMSVSVRMSVRVSMHIEPVIIPYAIYSFLDEECAVVCWGQCLSINTNLLPGHHGFIHLWIWHWRQTFS